MKREGISTVSSKHWIDERGFVYNKFHGNSFKDELKIKIVRDSISTILELCNDKAYPFLIDCTNLYGIMNPEIKKILAKNSALNKIREAEAFVVDSLSTRLVINFYLKFNKPNCPYKIFNNKPDAIKWLLKN